MARSARFFTASTSPPCSIFPRRSSTTNNCWKDSPVRHEAAGKVPRRGGPAGRPGGNDARRKPWRARGDVITQQAERWRTDLIGWALTDGAACLLYTSDAADDLLCVDLGGRRIIKKKKTTRRLTLTTPPL